MFPRFRKIRKPSKSYNKPFFFFTEKPHIYFTEKILVLSKAKACLYAGKNNGVVVCRKVKLRSPRLTSSLCARILAYSARRLTYIYSSHSSMIVQTINKTCTEENAQNATMYLIGKECLNCLLSSRCVKIKLSFFYLRKLSFEPMVACCK